MVALRRQVVPVRRRNVDVMAVLEKGIGGSAAQTYIDTVQGVQSANLIGYWPMTESSGATAVSQVNSPAQDGTYSGDVILADTTGPHGLNTALFNSVGSDGIMDFDSAAFTAAWNGAEYTISLWVKVAASEWVDGLNHYLYIIRADGNNLTYILILPANNQMRFITVSGNTTKFFDATTSSTDWMHLVITNSEADDEMIPYLDNTALVTRTALGTYNGIGLASAYQVVAAGNDSVLLPATGHIAHLAIWNTPLSTGDIDTLYTGST